MMKDKVNFVWDENHQKVFNDIKSEILLQLQARMVSEQCSHKYPTALNNQLYLFFVHYPMPKKLLREQKRDTHGILGYATATL